MKTAFAACLIFLALTIHAQAEGAAPFPTLDAAAKACAALAAADFSLTQDAPSQVIDAKIVAKHGEAPALCLVNGYVAPTVDWRMWLPVENWNGKYAQKGCGGRCGDIPDNSCDIIIERGYACIAADLGHKGTGYDNVWAMDNNLQGEIDLGFRATHVTNIIGKTVFAKFYGTPPTRSYYMGASTGGRQGLIEAQRFPRDFDGIVAGEPAMNKPGVAGDDGWNAYDRPGGALYAITSALRDGDGKLIFNMTELTNVHRAATDKCDMDDNIKDGLVADPRACRFDPADMRCKGDKTDSCLSQAQIEALHKIYAIGVFPGSEMHWLGSYFTADGAPGRYAPHTAQPYHNTYAWLFHDAANPDLRAFKAAGGKLIVYQGWLDEVALPLYPINYYETVERLMGGRSQTQDFFRLYMIPGQSHVRAPNGTDNNAETVDYLSAMEDWVEHGKPPERLVGYHLKKIDPLSGPVTHRYELVPENIGFTRPVYPYPIQARYSGKGDPNDAANFGPFDPELGK